MTLPPFVTALIIPTGIGASIGGFGGDGMTLLPLFSAISDVVITHPNVANAACFQSLPANTLYVEGYALDRFFQNQWSLQPVHQNRVGILWDSGIPEDMEILHRNAIAAVQTVYGVNVVAFEKTAEPIAAVLHLGESGRSTGKTNNPEVLLAAAEKLVSAGATAIAVCCLMPTPDEDQDDAYKSGGGVDPIAGLEAMISHYLVAQLQLPVAHAPVFPYEMALPVTDHLVDPRAASEFMVSTFLPCVLTGLSRAPQYVSSHQRHNRVNFNDLSALVVPSDALGSVPVLAALEKRIPVLAVQNNPTVMQAGADQLALTDRIIPCASYLEAAGYLQALKAGLTIPQHIRI